MSNKMWTAGHDLLIENSKLKSCFSFNNDLEVGEVGERFVASIFANPNVKIEVKKDDWTTRSGNVAIEFECRGKPSGILVTEADYWCHVIGHYFVLVFPVDFLKKVYEELKNQDKYVKNVGDRDAEGVPCSKVILLPWKELLKLFKDYEPCQSS